MPNDNFRGCILGQALADALGFTIEGQPPLVCAEYVREYLRTEVKKPRGRGKFEFGQYTDDTQLARELMQSLDTESRFSPEAYAQRIAAIFEEDRMVGYGRSTERAAGRLRRGSSWQQAGEQAPMAGNGSAMRAAPIGLCFATDIETLRRIAHEQSYITHQDPRCSAGSIAIAHATANALQGKVEINHFVDSIATSVRTMHPQFADCIEELKTWVGMEPKDVYKPIRRAGLARNFKDEWHGISPFVIGSVLFSLYAFLRTPNNYWETVCTALEGGGDADTTAAMAGAISGTYVGKSGLPAELLKSINDRNTWRSEDLTKLADSLHKTFGQ